MVAVIIDDDHDVRASLCALLESIGHEASAYTSAEDYLSQPRILADYFVVHHRLPGMTGLDLLESLRAEGEKTAAVVMVALPSASLAEQAGRIGVTLLERLTIALHIVPWIENVCGRRPPALEEAE